MSDLILDPLEAALEIVDELREAGREEEALALLLNYVLPALRERVLAMANGGVRQAV